MSYLLIKNAAQLATPEGHSASCGEEMSHLRVMADAAVLIEGEKILFVATTDEVEDYVKDLRPIQNNVMMLWQTVPVLSTHILLFGGYREHEFNLRLQVPATWRS